MVARRRQAGDDDRPDTQAHAGGRLGGCRRTDRRVRPDRARNPLLRRQSDHRRGAGMGGGLRPLEAGAHAAPAGYRAASHQLRRVGRHRHLECPGAGRGETAGRGAGRTATRGHAGGGRAAIVGGLRRGRRRGRRGPAPRGHENRPLRGRRERDHRRELGAACHRASGRHARVAGRSDRKRIGVSDRAAQPASTISRRPRAPLRPPCESSAFIPRSAPPSSSTDGSGAR